MKKEEAEEYIKKLEAFETSINEDNDELDLNFLGELNDLLEKLNTEMVNPKLQKKDFTNEDFDFSFNVNVKVKKLHENAVIPSYSKVGDAGMDLTITQEIENTTFSVSYGFGIAMEIPQGYVGLIFPRSSIRKQDLILSNCVGVIDSGYRGELQATFKKTNGLDSIKYKTGDRGAQIVILPYPQIKMTEVENLSNSERGSGGFGSTGN
jgi:dUTP pyrophosphatase